MPPVCWAGRVRRGANVTGQPVPVPVDMLRALIDAAESGLDSWLSAIPYGDPYDERESADALEALIGRAKTLIEPYE